MSLSIALAQIQRPSWWNSYPAAKPVSCNIKRKASSDYMREEIKRHLAQGNGKRMFADLAEDMEVTVASLRGLLKPLVDDGKVKRTIESNVVFIELVKGDGE